MPKAAKGRSRTGDRRARPASGRPAPRFDLGRESDGASSVPGASAGRPRSLAAVLIALCFLCALYPLHSWRSYRNVNEQARLYLVKAVVEEGALDIDKGIQTYGDLQDKATKDGHFYCDKPIGLSVVAVPVWFVLYHGGRLLGVAWSLQAMRYALTVLCVTL